MPAAFVLDTDTFTLLRQGHPEVCRRLTLHPPEDIALTVITVEEHLSGWYSLLRKARRPEQVALAYEQLAAAPQSLARLQILTYNLFYLPIRATSISQTEHRRHGLAHCGDRT